MVGALETFIKANAMPQQAVHGARIPKEITEANSCYVVSHPWFAREHCDPRGEKLKALVAQLDKLRAKDDALVFIDFLSIPQEDQFEKEIVKITKNMDEDLKKLKAPPDTDEQVGSPGYEEWKEKVRAYREGLKTVKSQYWPGPGENKAVRTLEENQQMQRALSNMSSMFAFGKFSVIVLPDVSVPEKETLGKDPWDTRVKWNTTPYVERGWCLFELCLSIAFGNVCNAHIDPNVQALVDWVTESNLLDPDVFEEQLFKANFSNGSDLTHVSGMFKAILDEGRTLVGPSPPGQLATRKGA